MELREVAERVLFSTRLEEKLEAPERITDALPGRAWDAPAAPGRPPELQFKPSGAGGRARDFPGLNRLGEPGERGRVLHFFANHELLATELMALVLLRFPEAPAAFRRGVYRTLREEQEHTRLYLDRMRECGIAFGELPVSGFFWRSVSTMQQPIDYVARLSLTFEQANLDFCREFGAAFTGAGDAQTGRLLERIYQDEIAHVAYGLRWFRRWKNPRQSDWEAYHAQLPFPLSPQRAKGLTLNVEGRRAAGLDAEFIQELDVYARSKGRTPSVFWFNPFAEGRIALGQGFTPVKYQAQLARDLATLPQFLCRQDDVVLAERPSVSFLQGLKRAGFALPEFVPAEGAGLRALSERKLGALRPWAWGPDSLVLLGPLLESVAGQHRAAESCFNERLAQLFSKAWSAGFLKRVLGGLGPSLSGAADWLCTEAEVGRAVSTMDQADAAIAAIRRRGHHRVVVKQAFGLAGHNAIRLWEPELLSTQRRWLASSLEAGRLLVVEPWLERVVDFSVQLEMRARGGGLAVLGYTGLSTDGKGQYRGNWAGPDFAKHLPAEVTAALGLAGDGEGRVRACYARILDRLGVELGALGYEGPAGIDAFVYREADGRCRLKPVVEINPRYTMGRMLVELMSRAAPGTHASLRLVGLGEAQAAGDGAGGKGGGFEPYARSLVARWPVRFVGHPAPRIGEGAVCLNDPTRAKVCLAVWQVGPASRIRA